MVIDIKTNSGYVLIAFVILNILVNGFFIVKSVLSLIKEKYLKLKRYCINRKIIERSRFNFQAIKDTVKIIINDEYTKGIRA